MRCCGSLQRASARRGARDDWSTRDDSLVHGGSRIDERAGGNRDRPSMPLPWSCLDLLLRSQSND